MIGSSPEGLPYWIFPVVSAAMAAASIALPKPTETYLSIACVWALGAAWWSRTALGGWWALFPVELGMIYAAPRCAVLLARLHRSGNPLGRALAVGVLAPAVLPFAGAIVSIVVPQVFSSAAAPAVDVCVLGLPPSLALTCSCLLLLGDRHAHD